MRTVRTVTGCTAVLVLMLGAATSILGQPTPKTWNGGGSITDPKGNGVGGVEVTVADSKTPGTVIARTTTNASGTYSFKNLSSSVSYKVTPIGTKGGYRFTPASGAINWTHPQADFKASK